MFIVDKDVYARFFIGEETPEKSLFWSYEAWTYAKLEKFLCSNILEMAAYDPRAKGY